MNSSYECGSSFCMRLEYLDHCGAGCLSGHVVDICAVCSTLCFARQYFRRCCFASGHSGTYAAFHHSFLELFKYYIWMGCFVSLHFTDSCDGIAEPTQQAACSSTEVLHGALGVDSNSSLYVGSCGTGGMSSRHSFFTFGTTLILLLFR